MQKFKYFSTRNLYIRKYIDSLIILIETKLVWSKGGGVYIVTEIHFYGHPLPYGSACCMWLAEIVLMIQGCATQWGLARCCHVIQSRQAAVISALLDSLSSLQYHSWWTHLHHREYRDRAPLLQLLALIEIIIGFYDRLDILCARLKIVLSGYYLEIKLLPINSGTTVWMAAVGMETANHFGTRD